MRKSTIINNRLDLKCFFYILWTLFVMLACSHDDNIIVVDDETYNDSLPEGLGALVYGVCWSEYNVNDMGRRCFDSKSLTARIGRGSDNGYSDFDSIYPWSEMKRCNVINHGGEIEVIFEGDDRFRLNDINTDVFVRIPKFGYRRYLSNGREYRVISKFGTPHPAFIEDGRELDEIFIGAFEGYVDTKGLTSVSDVIPSSGFTASEFLSLAQQRGMNYSLYDLRTIDMLYSLFAVEYGCRNTGNIIGYGISDYVQPLEKEYVVSSNPTARYSRFEEKNTNEIHCGYLYSDKISEGSCVCICRGSQNNILTFARVLKKSTLKRKNSIVYYFDGPAIDIDTDCFIGNCAQSTNWIETCSQPLKWHTGVSAISDGFDSRMRNPIRYRWIENVVGNLWHLLPDVVFKDRQMYVCENIRDYNLDNFQNFYQPVGDVLPFNDNNGQEVNERGKNFWVTSLTYYKDKPWICFGTSYNTQIYSLQSYGAYYYLRDGIMTIANGGGFDHRMRCNMLTNRAWVYPTQRWYLYGARLIYKNIE